MNVNKSAGELERLYPQSYYIIYPEVVRQCNRLDQVYGPMYMPNREQLEPVVDEIYNNVENQLNVDTRDYDSAQYGYRRRRRGFLGDLIWFVLLGELFGRRRRRRYPYYDYDRPYPRPYYPYR